MNLSSFPIECRLLLTPKLFFHRPLLMLSVCFTQYTAVNTHLPLCAYIAGGCSWSCSCGTFGCRICVLAKCISFWCTCKVLCMPKIAVCGSAQQLLSVWPFSSICVKPDFRMVAKQLVMHYLNSKSATPPKQIAVYHLQTLTHAVLLLSYDLEGLPSQRTWSFSFVFSTAHSIATAVAAHFEASCNNSHHRRG